MQIVSAEALVGGGFSVITDELGHVLMTAESFPSLYADLMDWEAAGGAISPPKDPGLSVPQSVSKAQGMMALYSAGLLGQLESLIANHPYPPVRIWFANANYWERSNPYIQSLGPELGLTEEDIDALFRAAALLAS